MPAEHRLESFSPLPNTSFTQEISERSNPSSAIPASFGDSSTDTSIASLEQSQLSRKGNHPTDAESTSSILAPSSPQTFSPSVTLHDQGENSSAGAWTASSSSTSPVSPRQPATFTSLSGPGQAATPTAEDTSFILALESDDGPPTPGQPLSSAPDPCFLAQTQTPKPHEPKGRRKGMAASNGGSRRRRRSIVNTNNAPIIPIPPLAASKTLRTSESLTIHPAPSTYPIQDYPKLRPTPTTTESVVPASALGLQQPVKGPSTSASAATAPPKTASQGKEETPYRSRGRRAPRRCSKCDIQGCRGAYKVKLCTNPCVGCGRADCDKPHRSKQNLCVRPSSGVSEVKRGREPDGEVVAVESSRSRSVRTDSLIFEADDAEVEAQLGDDVEDPEDFDGMALDYE